MIVSFHTFGCKSNTADTNSMAVSLLGNYDVELKENASVADIHIVNTCTVTASSDSQARNLLRKLDKLNQRSVIIVTGCSVRRSTGEYKQLFEELSGTNKYLCFDNPKEDLAELLGSILELRTELYLTSGGSSIFRTRAFLKVQDGCNNSCSYCIVPAVRGMERSTNMDEAVAEVLKLQSGGIKEVVLSGINVGAYSFSLRNFWSSSF